MLLVNDTPQTQRGLTGKMRDETGCGHPQHREAGLAAPTPGTGGPEGKRGDRDGRMRRLDGTTDSMDLSLSELGEMVMDREAWRVAIHGIAKSRTRLSD